MIDDRLDIVKEAFRQTELRLAELNRIAEAADRRAMAFVGFGGVIATLIFTLSPSMPIPIVGYLAGLVAFGGTWKASTSAFPRRFPAPGQFFDHWKDHLDDGDSLCEALIYRAKENDERIEACENSLDENAEQLKSGVSLVIWAGIMVSLIQAAAYIFSAS